jgi:hypothetical protein
MAQYESSDHFRLFAKRLEVLLAKYGKINDDERLAIQRAQMEKLFRLEQEFKKTLLSHVWGDSAYRAFVYHICVSNGNILTARPYFRERQETCIGPISAALENRDHKALYPYNFNYQFVSFIIGAYPWPAKSHIRVLAKQIERARGDILEFNLPLAISQARIFWSKAPSKAAVTHLQHMDFVEIACDGLISATDKFVLPVAANYQSEKEINDAFRKFRPMTVQRIVGNFIENFSETTIHFFPKDKRKIYRANKFIVRQQGPIDYEKVASAINVDENGVLVEPGMRTTAAEISSLLLAASGVTASETSSPDTTEEKENPLDRCPAEQGCRPDFQVENKEASDKLSFAMDRLNVAERKILRLKGVSLGDAIVSRGDDYANSRGF